MNELITTKTLEMKTGRKLFPEGIFGKVKDVNERKEILNQVEKELKERENNKRELTIYERAELGKELIKCIQKNNEKKVKELIEMGADINYKDGFGNTALIHSILDNHYEILELLIEKGADVDIKNCANNTALDLLSDKLYFNIDKHSLFYINIYNYIKLVFEKSNSVPLKLHKKLLSLLRFESDYPDVSDLIKLAIQKGADVNLRNNDLVNTTALIEAVKANDINFTEFLLNHGARIDIKDGSGKDAVAYITSVEMNSLFIDRDLIKVKWIDLLCFANLTTLVKYYYRKFKRISK